MIDIHFFIKKYFFFKFFGGYYGIFNFYAGLRKIRILVGNFKCSSPENPQGLTSIYVGASGIALWRIPTPWLYHHLYYSHILFCL